MLVMSMIHNLIQICELQQRLINAIRRQTSFGSLDDKRRFEEDCDTIEKQIKETHTIFNQIAFQIKDDNKALQKVKALDSLNGLGKEWEEAYIKEVIESDKKIQELFNATSNLIIQTTTSSNEEFIKNYTDNKMEQDFMRKFLELANNPENTHIKGEDGIWRREIMPNLIFHKIKK